MIVIASGKSHAEEMPELPQQAPYAFDRAWEDMQKDLTNLSTKGVFIKAEKSGHYVHWDEPELVVEAIYRLIRTIQHKSL